MTQSTPMTTMLRRLSSGEGVPTPEMLAEACVELRRIAASELRGGQRGQTLQITALVNEAVVRVLRAGPRPWADRKHFFASAACIMRRILVDHARRRKVRQGEHGAVRDRLDELASPIEAGAGDLTALDAALERLGEFDPEGARLVELRFFLGLSMEATADVLGISKRAAERRWTATRAWLFQELARDA